MAYRNKSVNILEDLNMKEIYMSIFVITSENMHEFKEKQSWFLTNK